MALKTVGIPKEIKPREYRVSMTPSGVKQLTNMGCRVLVESGAGKASGFLDSQYVKAGAILTGKNEVYTMSDMIVKVKEPSPHEYNNIRKGQILFTFFHFAGDPELEKVMREKEAICFAYESVQLEDGTLPILQPMSEIAGRLAVQEGMRFLTSNNDGVGILLSGVAGVEPAKVLIIGAGTVGTNAALFANALGARVYVLDTNPIKLNKVAIDIPGVVTMISSDDALRSHLFDSDLIIGAAFVPGKEAPKLVSFKMLHEMKRGSVFVDVAIDQGGMTDISVPRSHDYPVIRVKDTNLYCVPNMPGIVPNTSTIALTNSTLPYITTLVKKGWQNAVQEVPELCRALLV
jgi:alanine dehydrogenase